MGYVTEAKKAGGDSGGNAVAGGSGCSASMPSRGMTAG
jgi:hypothetical protein